MKGFIVWDTQIHGVGGTIDKLKQAGFKALGAGVEGGPIRENVLRLCQEAPRILALLDLPNVNVGFETGYSLGLGKPVALLHAGRLRPAWTDLPPLSGLACSCVPDYSSISNLPDRAYLSVNPWEAARQGSDTVLLCPRTGDGDAYRQTVLDLRPKWRELPQQNWSLTATPPAVLLRARRIVWIISPARTGEVRDGDENAANAVIAGFAKASGLTVEALIHDGVRSLADIVGEAHLFEWNDDLKPILDSLDGIDSGRRNSRWKRRHIRRPGPRQDGRRMVATVGIILVLLLAAALGWWFVHVRARNEQRARDACTAALSLVYAPATVPEGPLRKCVEGALANSSFLECIEVADQESLMECYTSPTAGVDELP